LHEQTKNVYKFNTWITNIFDYNASNKLGRGETLAIKTGKYIIILSDKLLEFAN